MTPSTTQASPFLYLRRALTGSVVTADDAGFDEARQAWHLGADQRPAAVAFPETAEDVVQVVRFARATGLRIAPQGTGHNAPPLGDLSRTILLKTSRMRGVEIDPTRRRARAEAGVLWAEVVEPAAAYGLSALHGSSPDVGVVGYSLGGGIGWQVRLHGLAANSVTAAELVTAEGQLVRVDAGTEPELFWALRGGGGNFGIVTALEFDLFPLESAYAGWLIWPWEQAETVLGAWSEWVETVPDEMTSVGRILQLPPLPFIPEPIRGRSIVVVEAAYAGTAAGGAAHLEALRALKPEIDTVAAVPATGLSRLHQDPEDPSFALVEHLLLSSLPKDGVDAFLSVAGPGSGSQILSAEIRHLGGAAGVPAPGGGALSHVDASFLTAAIALPMSPEMTVTLGHQLEAYSAALAPYGSGRSYLNFTEEKTDTESFFTAEAYHRLRTLRAKVDPAGLFQANHEIPVAVDAAAGASQLALSA
jgi:FAD/FMN-containing dehydrogenase